MLSGKVPSASGLASVSHQRLYNQAPKNPERTSIRSKSDTNQKSPTCADSACFLSEKYLPGYISAECAKNATRRHALECTQCF